MPFRTDPPIRRRTLLLAGAMAAAGSALASCATDPARDGAEGPPGRLVTLDGATAGLALILGVPQVGTASFLAIDPLVAAIAQIQSAPVANVSGPDGELDLERLAALSPDLLVGFREPRTPALAQLATLHTVPRTGKADIDCLTLAGALGVEHRARAVVAAAHDRIAEISTRLRSRRPTTVSVLSPGLDGQSLYVLGTATPAGAVAEALELPRPDAQRGLVDPGMPFLPVSTERLTEHDADLVLLLTGPTADPAFLRDEPLWQRLDAVRTGRVVEVDALRWATMSCLLGTLWVLDDLAALLIDEGTVVTAGDSPAGLARLGGYRTRFASA
jgi:ABC-type Fe3+-hydroxamate transport system substrate-binding protein